MSLFLYYIPTDDEQPLSTEMLHNVGLRDIFDSTEQCAATRLEPRQCPLGGGYLIADREALGADRTLSFGDMAQWKKRGECYVRLYDGRPISPESLRRPTMLRGAFIMLDNGSPWQVPIGCLVDRDMSTRTALPAKMDIDEETDEWVAGKVLGRYEALEDLTKTWWDGWLPGAKHAIESGEISKWKPHVSKPPCNEAARVLAANYRVGRVECALLGLFTTEDNASDIMSVLIDAGSACQFMLDAVEKKNSYSPTADLRTLEPRPSPELPADDGGPVDVDTGLTQCHA